MGGLGDPVPGVKQRGRRMSFHLRVVEGVVIDENPTATITYTVYNRYGSSTTQHSNVLFIQSRDGGVAKAFIENSSKVSAKVGHLVRIVFVEPGNYLVGLRNETLNHWWTWKPRADMSTLDGWRKAGCLWPTVLVTIAILQLLAGMWQPALAFFTGGVLIALVGNAPARRRMKESLAERDRLMRAPVPPLEQGG